VPLPNALLSLQGQDMSDIAKLHRALKRFFPNIKTRLVLCILGENIAECKDIKGRGGERVFQINIDQRLEPYIACWFLVHEFAHAVTFDEKEQHGDAWGLTLAACVRVWERLNAKEKKKPVS